MKKYYLVNDIKEKQLEKFGFSMYASVTPHNTLVYAKKFFENMQDELYVLLKGGFGSLQKIEWNKSKNDDKPIFPYIIDLLVNGLIRDNSGLDAEMDDPFVLSSNVIIDDYDEKKEQVMFYQAGMNYFFENGGTLVAASDDTSLHQFIKNYEESKQKVEPATERKKMRYIGKNDCFGTLNYGDIVEVVREGNSVHEITKQGLDGWGSNPKRWNVIKADLEEINNEPEYKKLGLTAKKAIYLGTECSRLKVKKGEIVDIIFLPNKDSGTHYLMYKKGLDGHKALKSGYFFSDNDYWFVDKNEFIYVEEVEQIEPLRRGFPFKKAVYIGNSNSYLNIKTGDTIYAFDEGNEAILIYKKDLKGHSGYAALGFDEKHYWYVSRNNVVFEDAPKPIQAKEHVLRGYAIKTARYVGDDTDEIGIEKGTLVDIFKYKTSLIMYHEDLKGHNLCGAFKERHYWFIGYEDVAEVC